MRSLREVEDTARFLIDEHFKSEGEAARKLREQLELQLDPKNVLDPALLVQLVVDFRVEQVRLDGLHIPKTVDEIVEFARAYSIHWTEDMIAQQGEENPKTLGRIADEESLMALKHADAENVLETFEMILDMNHVVEHGHL